MLFFPIIYNNFMVWYPASTSDWTGSDPSVLFNGMLAHVRYVKIYLETDKAHASKKRTSVKRNTTDPVYNEVLQVHSISPPEAAKSFRRIIVILI